MQDTYLRIGDLTATLPISRPTIYRMIQKNEFPKPFKLGSASVWIKREVDEFMEELKKTRSA